jgi:orotate phosphoribosyltransferase-like protein
MKLKVKILKLKRKGICNKEIAEKLGCSPTTITYHCNEAYRKRHTFNRQRRRSEIKTQIVNQFGGKCKICGYDRCVDALEFHHTKDKDSVILLKGSAGLSRLPFKILMAELKKCILLCCRCHREVHAGVVSI